mmetsp:Transcript_16270/g.35800  ORF Transcript_16270/g.35800 Transcript_16270/m.35800 type:complete len:231 (+) Transcript_16270:53-745(+)
MLRRCISFALGLLLAACLSQVSESFLQPVPTTGCRRAQLPTRGQTELRQESKSTGSGVIWALLGVVALARRPFAGHGTSHVTSSNMLVAQPGDAVDIDSPTVMGQIPRRPHVRIAKRTLKEWKRGRRLNSAAKQRYLIRKEPSGRLTVWRRQWGQRNLKSKKSPAHLRRLKGMVRIHRAQYKRVQLLLHIHIKPPSACDFIMRKFCEHRLKDHLGMSDDVGVSMWTGPKC